ncbi:hypothetical protein TNCV_86511 [Trichonephila clavipes]|nr:hypothetical protein TNCV_86511 [Trichonephila clavipes]
MSSRHHIDDFMRGRIIGKIEEGRKITDVAREFDIAHSVVSRLWKSFKTTGMCSRFARGSSTSSCSSFRGAVGDKFVFYGRQRNMSSNTRCSGLSRQRGYSTSRMASAFSRSKTPLKMCGCFGRQVAGRNYPPTNKNTLIRALRGMG